MPYVESSNMCYISYILQDSVPMSNSGGASSHATWQKSALRLQLAGTELKLIRTYMKNSV